VELKLIDFTLPRRFYDRLISSVFGVCEFTFESSLESIQMCAGVTLQEGKARFIRLLTRENAADQPSSPSSSRFYFSILLLIEDNSIRVVHNSAHQPRLRKAKRSSVRLRARSKATRNRITKYSPFDIHRNKLNDVRAARASRLG
jgi:hypothetical protein